MKKSILVAALLAAGLGLAGAARAATDAVDSLVLFHQENGVWKLWSDEVLGVELGAK